ncbi:uncharacterized protein LOC128742096 [Sabethes cyaneus]|uniref:uncharacterized protein LOC128742096 n=1 Tax=Sabethes cyaneus TaxID=53552 RepID=UPI00237E2F7B|nr:uncharacterized protein LOC128742096 [Sabethes cyaneus]
MSCCFRCRQRNQATHQQFTYYQPGNLVPSVQILAEVRLQFSGVARSSICEKLSYSEQSDLADDCRRCLTKPTSSSTSSHQHVWNQHEMMDGIYEMPISGT